MLASYLGVKKAMAAVRQWLGDGQAQAGPPFEVACVCGALCSGVRRRQHQAVSCPKCQRPLFVLPISPFDPGWEGPQVVAPAAPAPAPRPGNPWRGPLLAGSACLIAFVLIYFFIFRLLLTGDPQVRIEEQLAEGRKALAEGDFAKAAERLGSAQGLLRKSPHALPAAEARQLAQAYRQAALLADWLREPLEDALARAAKLQDDEWQGLVERKYRGRGVVLDVDVRRDAAGGYRVDLRRPLAVKVFHLDLRDLALLRRLPLGETQRLVLGGRIADLRRTDAGLVAVRLEPESGVLLTDPAVVAAVKFLARDNAFQETIKKQEEWAAEIP